MTAEKDTELYRCECGFETSNLDDAIDHSGPAHHNAELVSEEDCSD